MKKYLLISLFFYTTNFVYSQVEFAPLGANYYYLGEYQINNSGPFIPYINTISVLSDTTINGQSCRKISSGSMKWHCGDFSNPYFYMYEEEGRVYYLNTNTSSFELFYDFNKNLGESWVVPSFCGDWMDSNCPIDTLTIFVDSVSYIDVNGISLKTQHVSIISDVWSGSPSVNIYEGIGCLEHFFYFKEEHCSTAHDWIRGLRCFDSPVDGLFSFYEDEGTCEMPVSLASINNSSPFTIYPNPVSSHLTVSGQGYFNIQLLDVNGQSLYDQEKIYKVMELELTDYPNGIYFLKIEKGDRIFTKKIIKY